MIQVCRKKMEGECFLYQYPKGSDMSDLTAHLEYTGDTSICTFQDTSSNEIKEKFRQFSSDELKLYIKAVSYLLHEEKKAFSRASQKAGRLVNRQDLHLHELNTLLETIGTTQKEFILNAVLDSNPGLSLQDRAFCDFQKGETRFVGEQTRLSHESQPKPPHQYSIFELKEGEAITHSMFKAVDTARRENEEPSSLCLLFITPTFFSVEMFLREQDSGSVISTSTNNETFVPVVSSELPELDLLTPTPSLPKLTVPESEIVDICSGETEILCEEEPISCPEHTHEKHVEIGSASSTSTAELISQKETERCDVPANAFSNHQDLAETRDDVCTERCDQSDSHYDTEIQKETTPKSETSTITSILETSLGPRPTKSSNLRRLLVADKVTPRNKLKKSRAVESSRSVSSRLYIISDEKQRLGKERRKRIEAENFSRRQHQMLTICPTNHTSTKETCSKQRQKDKSKIYQTNPTASSKPFVRSIQLFERSRRRNEEGKRRRMQVQTMIAKAKPSPPTLGMNHLQVFERSIRDANRNLMARFDIV